MAKKRKHDSKSGDDSAEPPQKQQQQDQELQQLNQQQDLEDQDNIKEVDEEEEYEEVEEEEEEEDEEDDNQIQNQTADNQTEASNQEDEDDDEPIQMLLEPFGRDQLVTLLREAANNHPDIADRIRSMANGDPAHRKIFVHGLGWDTTAETLIENFKQYGDIEDCKAVTDKISGKSKGYGFILFKSRTGARKALKQPQKKIGNRMTACQLASTGPVGAAPVTHVSAATTAQQQSSEYTQRKIYISNVGSDLDPQKLLGFFSKFGEIEEGPLGLDKSTGKPKGFCLFVYRTVESARKALEEPHKNFEGHILHCQKAIDGPKPGKAQHHHNTHGHNPRFHRNDHSGYAGGAGGGSGHLMAPTAALNPALGQALTALLASQGAGLGLNPALGQALLGQLGTTPATAMQGGYGSQANVMGGYGSQGGLQAAYPNQQQGGQGNAGRGQHGVGQYGASYMGH